VALPGSLLFELRGDTRNGRFVNRLSTTDRATTCDFAAPLLLRRMIESRFGLTPLSRCIEGLRLAEEIGNMPDTRWFVARVIDTYTASFGGEYVDEMRVLEALRILWGQRCGERGAIFDYIVQRQQDCRDKASPAVRAHLQGGHGAECADSPESQGRATVRT